ncbi:LOW QUALITY PROTEIN: protein PTST homolog 3, chloroplastic [Pyrus x bretschneideri]|uniref:LOW QUALITY PROTEIN: protein PTST homolog 3, chloroplastic n=1 Tax=Pyrus x bretschneideri TaxID=225117 RepID=UPI00202E00BD|nr:LOW QUALITY PROTEIN: protein PTST homolog 3, chloroplastic [Pyrus x bretschneideri]
MAATVSHLPAFLSLFSQRNLFLVDPQHQSTLRFTAQQRRPEPRYFTLQASSVKKKTSRKVKSNAELCNELRQFLTAVGLPECHIPSLKELSQHGRDDLANIVRRRGYKLLRELLADSSKKDAIGKADNGFAGIQVAIDDRKKIVTGQDPQLNDSVEDFSSSSEVSVLETNSGSLISHPDPSRDDSGCLTVESSADLYNLEGHSEKVDNVNGSGSVPTKFSVMENQSRSSKIGPPFNSDIDSNMPSEISTPSSLGEPDDVSLPTTVHIKETNTCSSNVGLDLNSDGCPRMPVEPADGLSLDEKVLDICQDGKVNSMTDEDSSSAVVSGLEDHSSSNLESSHNSDYHYPPLESPPNLSLEEKVANFMQNGDLDAVEDNVYGIVTENNAEEIKGGFGNTEEVQLRTPTSGHSKNVLDGRDATMALNQRTSTSTMAVDPSLSRDDGTPAEGLSSLYDKDLDVKTNERDYELDVSHLKFMLHQKEIELSQLKEQIKKEQLALSNLQTKAEMAISKAQKLVSEKDAELLAAEENLSGLVEVEIQYEGDGEIVEVTGSFNGWHHQIKMDLESSSSIIEPLRKPKLWSTMLWLYPGTYEIKFIVDGQWKIDPQRESVTRGTICNNILRVDR